MIVFVLRMIRAIFMLNKYRMEFPFREEAPNCIEKNSYRYYFNKDNVFSIWDNLSKQYGKISRDFAFKTMEIKSKDFFFRSTEKGNPILVIPKRGCTQEAIDGFHRLAGFKSE